VETYGVIDITTILTMVTRDTMVFIGGDQYINDVKSIHGFSAQRACICLSKPKAVGPKSNASPRNANVGITVFGPKGLRLPSLG
jgi:hypothetical protein